MVISVVVLGGCWWVLASLVIMAAESPLAVLMSVISGSRPGSTGSSSQSRVSAVLPDPV